MTNEYYAVVWSGPDFDEANVRLVGPLPDEIEQYDLPSGSVVVLPMSWPVFSREGEDA